MVTEKSVCPCCGYKTFPEPLNGNFFICEVCYWEDDPLQQKDPNYEGGANKVSLKQAQSNFMAFGACERGMIKHVRLPAEEEQRDADWKPLS